MFFNKKEKNFFCYDFEFAFLPNFTKKRHGKKERTKEEKKQIFFCLFFFPFVYLPNFSLLLLLLLPVSEGTGYCIAETKTTTKTTKITKKKVHSLVYEIRTKKKKKEEKGKKECINKSRVTERALPHSLDRSIMHDDSSNLVPFPSPHISPRLPADRSSFPSISSAFFYCNYSNFWPCTAKFFLDKTKRKATVIKQQQTGVKTVSFLQQQFKSTKLFIPKKKK